MHINGYLAALGEAIATRHSNEADGTLDDICNQSKEAVSFDSAQLETYVSTENLLPNKAGLQLSAGLPTSGKVTRYRKGDTLIANIRPYFKKIWYATDEGTCSGDVIVFRANDVRYAPYVFFSLFCDEFFKYVMLGAKGTKMPRGDKKQMMTFPICTNCNSTDLQLLHELASMIGTNHAESRQLARLRDVLLPELMSGEIDVSKVDLTQLNSHLAQIRKLNADCRICDVFPEPTIRRLYLISNLWRNESCFLLIIAYLFDRLSSIFDKMTYFLSNILDKMQSEYRAHEKAPSGYFRSGLR